MPLFSRLEASFRSKNSTRYFNLSGSISFLPYNRLSGVKVNFEIFSKTALSLYFMVLAFFQSTANVPSTSFPNPNSLAANESLTQYTNWRYSLFVISVASIQKPFMETCLLRAVKLKFTSSSLGPMWNVPGGTYTIPSGLPIPARLPLAAPIN